VSGAFEGGELVGAQLVGIVFGRYGAGGEADEGGDLFAEAVVGDADDCAEGDRWVAVE
jgi:hypothetical protein